MSRLGLLAWRSKDEFLKTVTGLDEKAYYWARVKGSWEWGPYIVTGLGAKHLANFWEVAGPIPEPVSQNDNAILEEFAEKLLTRARVIDEDDGA